MGLFLSQFRLRLDGFGFGFNFTAILIGKVLIYELAVYMKSSMRLL